MTLPAFFRLAATTLAAAVVSLAAGGAALAAATSAVVDTGHVRASLVAEPASAAPGASIYLALRQEIAPGWHTYWRNPGDAGQAPVLTWTLPVGWRAGDIVWPVPRRELAGPLMSYVYTGAVDLPVSTARAQLNPDGGAAVAATLAATPQLPARAARFQASGDTVKLEVPGVAVDAAEAAHAYFFPYDGTALEQAKPEKVERGAQGVTLDLPAGYAFTSGKPPSSLQGVLAVGSRSFVVAATPGSAPAGTSGLGAPVQSTPAPDAGASIPGSALDAGGNGLPSAAMGLVEALALAFLGGVVLNLMPCVFPVLSMKAAALARHAEAPGEARREGVGFLVGVVTSLMTLAVVLVAARAAGQAIGWGFQMQSPPFVATLGLVMLLAALNLSGVFEIGLSLQGAGAERAARTGGLAGSVLTGALAVVVAAPCSAPFMAGAIGWALAQPPASALLVFLALALGLAAPFTLLAFAPRALARFPRPGPWMERLRQVLAFPMYAAAAWLAWVFASQTGLDALPWLFAAALATAFAAWCWGIAQRAPSGAGTRGPALLARGLAALALVGAGVCVAAGAAEASAAPASSVAGRNAASTILALAEPWSPERVAALTAQGRPVFVDFTAAWCLSCQVNERTTLSSARVKAAFDRTQAVYLKADWTRYDPAITRALAQAGRSGVPLYLVYRPGAAAPRVLPQLLTPNAVAAALSPGNG